MALATALPELVLPPAPAPAPASKVFSFKNLILLILSCSVCLCQNEESKIGQESRNDSCSIMTSIQTLLSVTAAIKNEFSSAHYVENVPIKSEYDFVIVGASPAGCVLANRLSEDGNYSVLLLEAGSAENPMLTNIPMGAPNLQLSKYNWDYSTEEQSDACLGMRDKRCNWPHGRGLGGSSIINYMIYTRGNPRDFDKWTKAGIAGWSYDEVLPYFQKFEKSTIKKSNQTTNSTSQLGEHGLLTIESARYRTPIANAFVDSAMLLNYSNVDYNTGEQIGVSYLQSSTRNGWRQTAAKAFLADIKQRTNLDISLRSWASKLIFNAHGDRVKGVKFYRNKKETMVKVRKEVILSAGAFESPKLLMLSGIGPEDHLNEMNIKMIKDLPVGQTLYEHMAVYGPVFTADNLNDGLVNMNDVVQTKPILELLDGKGPMTSTGIESLLYMKANNSVNSDPSIPDLELLQSFASIAFDTAHGVKEGVRLSDKVYDAVFKPLEQRRAFQILPLLLHPRSKGYLKLKSRNPFHHPLLYPNFFNDTRDIDTLLDGVREILRISSQKPFVELGVKLHNATVPGCENTTFNSDDYWRCYIRHLSASLHHQLGTCKMGPKTDPTSVVDSMARVHGMKNLRVADISIIPEAPSGHTAAFSFMIGEKIADLIRDQWKSTNGSHIQNLLRNRRLIVDWLYQDPDHTTEAKSTSTSTSQFPFYRLTTPQTTTAIPMSAMHMEALKSLNMDDLKKNSEKFKNSTIGDVGTILWGSPSSSSHKIDFKTKLAEHLNSTELELNVTTTEAPRKPVSFTDSQSKIIRVTQKSDPMTTAITTTKTTATAKEPTEIETEMSVTGSTSDASTDATSIATSTMSNMEKILATAPSLDEETVRKFKLNNARKSNGKISDKQIADKINDTTAVNNDDGNIKININIDGNHDDNNKQQTNPISSTELLSLQSDRTQFVGQSDRTTENFESTAAIDLNFNQNDTFRVTELRN